MKNEKKQLWVFVFIKYGKFWSDSLEHYIEHKPLISEEWVPSLSEFTFPWYVMVFQKCWEMGKTIANQGKKVCFSSENGLYYTMF